MMQANLLARVPMFSIAGYIKLQQFGGSALFTSLVPLQDQSAPQILQLAPNWQRFNMFMLNSLHAEQLVWLVAPKIFNDGNKKENVGMKFRFGNDTFAGLTPAARLPTPAILAGANHLQGKGCRRHKFRRLRASGVVDNCSGRAIRPDGCTGAAAGLGSQ